jgi:hypothetical protein
MLCKIVRAIHWRSEQLNWADKHCAVISTQASVQSVSPKIVSTALGNEASGLLRAISDDIAPPNASQIQLIETFMEAEKLL